MPKKAKTGQKSYPWTKAQERRIMALAVEAVRADWAAESAKLNRRSVETPAFEAPSAADTTQGLSAVERIWSDWSGVDRAVATFGVAERTDPSEVIRQMQRERGDRRGYVHLTCCRPNPEQIAEGIAAAADYLAQTDEAAGGGGQIAPPPVDPASPAAFDAAVAANKAIFSLREAGPSEKINFLEPKEFWAGWPINPYPPSDTTADGTQSGETGPAKNENFRWDHHPTVTTGNYHTWTAAQEPTGFFAGLLDEQKAEALLYRGEDTPAPVSNALEDFPPNSVWTDEVAAWKGEFHRVLRGDLGRGRRMIRTRSGRVIDVDAAGLTVVPAPQATRDALDPVPAARVPICAGGVWLTASWSRGEVVCSVCGVSRLAHPAVPEKTDSPPANTHLGIMPGGRPLGPPKVNGLRTWWETIMTDVEALPRGNQITLSPWQVRHLYDALHAWGYRSGRKTP